MSEPGAVAGAVQQTSTQGIVSQTVFPTAFISNIGADSLQVNPTNGGVGFGNRGDIPSSKNTGQDKENDEIADEISGEAAQMGEESFTTEYIGESPFYKYNVKPLSSGAGQVEQKYHGERVLGRGMNMGDIRNGYYYGEEESSIFTWDLSAKEPNITMDEIDRDDMNKLRDV